VGGADSGRSGRRDHLTGARFADDSARIAASRPNETRAARTGSVGRRLRSGPQDVDRRVAKGHRWRLAETVCRRVV